ncbi:PQQ-binding-like beta-propeller repeat protein [Cellulomonas shaoxiangyii]|uniref:Pyrrolo-quinoline quinone repeat domain-containing protein n=1 Tax=Cellulomonas shaoxiangyii TaxID=2566013 RepID=A0A4P7SH20_9CELL|nr:PQQ-binding-like beta-propeller repeat protein [Cellulomonas shaoxiangyii]QCB92396.1 hypothetical protein E5225_01345 [Cellulomonas shaoxiangyii]TGY82192.1 hypothetical protein E5226_13385 [Cellulomonas shaoxiangyii]
MARARPTQEVDLVEDEPARAAAGEDGDGRPAGRRRWWVVGGAGAVVLVGALVAAQAVVDDRERARLDDVREVPGAVAPPAGALEVLWTAPDVPPYADGWHDPRTFAGLRTTSDGATEVAAVDALTGADRWVLPLVPAPEADDAQAFRVGSRCAAADDDRLVCLGSDAVLTRPGDEPRATTGAGTTSRVVVVDVRTGEVAADHAARSAEGVHAHAFALAGERVVLVGTAADGTSHAWSLDLASGLQAGGEALPAADDRLLPAAAADIPYALGDGTVGVAAQDGSALVLDPADARVVRGPLRGTSPAVVTHHIDGRTDLAVPRGEDADVVRAAGDLRVPGRLLNVMVDDGSVPGVLFTEGAGRVHAVDARTGEVRWEAAVALPNAVGVLDGRVHVPSPATLVTLDGRTGARLWERERWSTVWGAGVLTDGTLLYEPRASTREAGRPELVGLDPADGAERGVVSLPPDVWSVIPWGGRLVELEAAGVTVLR